MPDTDEAELRELDRFVPDRVPQPAPADPWDGFDPDDEEAARAIPRRPLPDRESLVAMLEALRGVHRWERDGAFAMRTVPDEAQRQEVRRIWADTGRALAAAAAVPPDEPRRVLPPDSPQALQALTALADLDLAAIGLGDGDAERDRYQAALQATRHNVSLFQREVSSARTGRPTPVVPDEPRSSPARPAGPEAGETHEPRSDVRPTGSGTAPAVAAAPTSPVARPAMAPAEPVPGPPALERRGPETDPRRRTRPEAPVGERTPPPGTVPSSRSAVRSEDGAATPVRRPAERGAMPPAPAAAAAYGSSYRAQIAAVERRTETWAADVGAAYDTWKHITGRGDPAARELVRDLTAHWTEVARLRSGSVADGLLAAPVYRSMATAYRQVSWTAARLAARTTSPGERMALRALARSANETARDLRSVSKHFAAQERRPRRGLVRVIIAAAQERAERLVARRSARWDAVRAASGDERARVAGELRTEYEQARPWLHAARQNWWMDQATPQELGAAWQVATEWAAHGDLYADRTLHHLRDQIRARHAVEIPHHTLTGADLVAILANPRPDAAAPSGGPAVYRYTVTDDLAPGSPVTGYTSAAAGEDPELLLARVLTDHARAAGRPAAGFRAELSYSDADRAPGALAVALDGAGAETRLANEQQQRLLQHAVLLREHLTPERFRTLEPAEAGQWWATVTSWTEGPARRETLEFLAGRMDEAYGFRPDEGETAEQVAERAHRATDGRARVDARPPRPEHPPTFTVETAGSGVEALLTGLDEKIRAAVREEIRALVPPGSAADSALRAYVDSGSLGVREEPREAAGGPAEASALPRGGEPAGRRMTADERRAAVAGAAVVPVLRSPDTRVVRTPTLLPAPSEIPLGR